MSIGNHLFLESQFALANTLISFLYDPTAKPLTETEKKSNLVFDFRGRVTTRHLVSCVTSVVAHKYHAGNQGLGEFPTGGIARDFVLRELCFQSMN